MAKPPEYLSANLSVNFDALRDKIEQNTKLLEFITEALTKFFETVPNLLQNSAQIANEELILELRLITAKLEELSVLPNVFKKETKGKEKEGEVTSKEKYKKDFWP